MGWNNGYTIYEITIIETYNKDVLDADLCGKLIEPYQGTDIDHGGGRELKSKDGLNADQIVVMMLDPVFWKNYKEKELQLVEKYGKWEDAYRCDYDSPEFKAFE